MAEIINQCQDNMIRTILFDRLKTMRTIKVVACRKRLYADTIELIQNPYHITSKEPEPRQAY